MLSKNNEIVKNYKHVTKILYKTTKKKLLTTQASYDNI